MYNQHKWLDQPRPNNLQEDNPNNHPQEDNHPPEDNQAAEEVEAVEEEAAEANQQLDNQPQDRR
jgi:hypothetical protein